MVDYYKQLSDPKIVFTKEALSAIGYLTNHREHQHKEHGS